MKTTKRIAAAVAACLAAGGCAKTATTPPPPMPPVKTSDTYPLIACDTKTVPKPTGAPYVITLGPSFDLRNAVVGKSPNSTGPNPHPPAHGHNTALDITTQISGAASGTIQIVLTDSSLHFMDKPLALVGATSNAPSVFCDVSIDTTGKYPTLTFTVYPLGSYAYASYNLGLLVDQNGPPGQPQLPVIIDPWADNNGIVSLR
jgi:hypothetical protein